MFKICSPLKLLNQSQPNFAEMICGWFSSKIVSSISELRPRWPQQSNLAWHRTLWEIHIKIFSSETTGLIPTKLWWNGLCMASFQSCVRWSRFSTKMAAKLEIEKGGMKFKKNVFLWNNWANLNQTLLRWSFGGPLPKLNPAFQTSDRNDRHSRT